MTQQQISPGSADINLRPYKRRRGVVFYVVLAVTTIMGIFILFYQNFSRQLAFSSFYHVNRERVRNLTEVVIDSAFSNLQIATRDATNPLARQLVEQMKSAAITNSPFALQAPLFEANKNDLLLGASFNYTLNGRIFDKRIQAPQGQKYHPGEGLATLEIAIDAALETPSGKVLAKCKRLRHYDIKISCLVSNFVKRQNSYAMTFPLDFALLVRNGLREFKDGYRGQSYNEGLKLQILDQSTISANLRGLVYFGKADRNNEDARLYLNTSDDNSSDSIIPSLPIETFTIDQEECFKIFPNEAADNIRGLKGKFTLKTYPAARTGAPENDNEKNARTFLSYVSATNALEPKPAGISFSSFNKAYLDSILRGAVTQRFLYVVRFDFDSSACEINDGSDWIPANNEVHDYFKDKGTLTFSPNSTYLRTNTSANAQTTKETMQRIMQTAQRVNAPIPLVSDLHEDYLPYSGQALKNVPETEAFNDPPRFLNRSSTLLSDLTMTGGEGFRPFRHYTLCVARYFYAHELESSGIYDRKNGVLNLRGIVSVEQDHVTFNPPPGKDHIIIKGCGAILAPNGFTINCGLKRENPAKDLCILFTRRSNIRIATSSRIEASLLAFNDSNNASIVPSKPFEIVGSVGVDQLYLNRFPTTPSKIEFDPRLKTDSDANEVFSLNISPWIRYDDMSFSKE